MLGRNDPPEVVAASFALGVAISFTPLIGFHWILALGLAVLLKLNKVDILLGTLVVNPLTIAPISALAIPLGRTILRAERVALAHQPLKEFLSLSFWSQAGPRMRAVGLQWATGMFILSFVAGALTYVLLVNILRARRAREAAAAALPPGAIPGHVAGGDGEEDSLSPPR
jgi:hypothetical protein